MNDFSNLIKAGVRYSPQNDFEEVGEELFYRKLENQIEDFVFLVGFPKAATSTIASLLGLHKSVCLAVGKEPFFFPSEEYEFGMGFYWKKYFDHYNGESVVLDANTANSFVPFVSKRIANKLPEAKIIFSIRNPIDRAYSNWKMYKLSGEENLTFQEAIKWEQKELAKNLIPYKAEDHDFWKWYMERMLTRSFYLRRRTVRTYLTRGFYAEHIRRFLKYFDKEQILIVQQEKLGQDKEEVLRRLINFLDLPNKDIPDLIEESEDYHRSPNSVKLGTVTNKAIKFKAHVPSSIWKLASILRNFVGKNLPKDRVKGDLREELRTFYEGTKNDLNGLIDIDLSAWDI